MRESTTDDASPAELPQKIIDDTDVDVTEHRDDHVRLEIHRESVSDDFQNAMIRHGFAASKIDRVDGFFSEMFTDSSTSGLVIEYEKVGLSL
jgi:hypothetical protein